VLKRGPRGKLIMGVNSTHLLNLLSLGINYNFMFECMKDQSLNSCKKVGVVDIMVALGGINLHM
jgi:hypothetical protein